ncbi:YybH family protein [Streptomyces flavofungini]|uniref:YybH family protein n=1 Tax=Streptomyces flavofungini TaxID=68200 RepID=UPI0034DE9DB5
MADKLNRRLILGSAAVAAVGAYAAAPASASAAGAKDDERELTRRARSWVFGWNRAEDSGEFVFRDTFGHLYDWHGKGTLYYDDADAQHRIARSAAEYESMWEPVFNGLRAAEHWIAMEPDVVLSGDLASVYLGFVARITGADGTVTGLRATSALVWRRTRDGWRITRDHTSSFTLTPDELASAISEAERRGGHTAH